MRRIIKNSSLTDSQIGKREEEARRKAHPTLIVTVHSHTARSSNVFAHSLKFDFVEGMRSPLNHFLTKCAAECAFLSEQ